MYVSMLVISDAYYFIMQFDYKFALDVIKILIIILFFF